MATDEDMVDADMAVGMEDADTVADMAVVMAVGMEDADMVADMDEDMDEDMVDMVRIYFLHYLQCDFYLGVME